MQAKRQCGGSPHRLLAPVGPLPLLSRRHSTALPSLKRYSGGVFLDARSARGGVLQDSHRPILRPGIKPISATPTSAQPPREWKAGGVLSSSFVLQGGSAHVARTRASPTLSPSHWCAHWCGARFPTPRPSLRRARGRCRGCRPPRGPRPGGKGSRDVGRRLRRPPRVAQNYVPFVDWCAHGCDPRGG